MATLIIYICDQCRQQVKSENHLSKDWRAGDICVDCIRTSIADSLIGDEFACDGCGEFFGGKSIIVREGPPPRIFCEICNETSNENSKRAYQVLGVKLGPSTGSYSRNWPSPISDEKAGDQ